ncbi:DUF928 domain-containing protein [Argonema antarcticum]|uniref:DUF928 domain-containing protein n=1 Tax=Argonema antarcticum TaxID=2942763 RepID=UPI0020116117|nr:DUF928 domain-containing protein [Argonema antarcticum]MCL1469875.1 DUF928 domain-containing protein [Argonema antarcticum A004/B2]
MILPKQSSLLHLAISSIILIPNLADNAHLATAAMRREIGVVAEYEPPKGIGAPPTVPGGSRSGKKCDQDANVSQPGLTPIIPDASLANGLGLTVSENPQFFVYVPQTLAGSVEFVLKDEEEKDLYRANLPINGKAGIVGLSLPTNTVKLEVGKNYHWYFSIICNPRNRRKDLTVDGWSRRVEMPANLVDKLKSSSERDRANLYAQNGIWHEAVSTLAEERRKAPNDSELAAEWKKLLESAKVKEIGDVPFTVTQLEGE